MIRFECDYAEGMHPAILDALIKTNEEQTPGYGVDTHCEHARELIKKACHREDVDVHFLVGGTQTNATIIAAGLRPYQGVLSAVTGHINVHETGAIESYGHKVLPLPSEDGKITAAHTFTMAVSSIWYSRVWYTSPSLQRMVPYIPEKSFRKSATYAAGQGYTCSLTVRAADMV